ncbi:MAG: hypothetical protein HPY65_16695 [Syntrophaceae bacterium]|nr:hypothetical protein [Syntrophaceae bacterium]
MEPIFFFTLIFPFSILVPIIFSTEDNKCFDILMLSLFVMPVVYGLILTVVERRGFPVKDAAIMIGLVHLAAALICRIMAEKLFFEG